MPGAPGTYVLLMSARRARVITAGRRLRVALHPGWYLYVGSAFGPGGLRARVSRHCRRDKPLRWHIDYLRRHTRALGAWYASGEPSREHVWAARLAERLDVITGFGASDCDCPGHLFHTEQSPSRPWITACLGEAAWWSVQRT